MKDVRSCGTIIVDGQKVLLVCYIAGDGTEFWGFPKGHQEKGENDLETALRETKEEVGLEVEITNPNPIEVSHLRHNGQGTKYIGLFAAKPLGSTKPIRQVEEINIARWVDFTEAAQLLTEHNQDAWQQFLARYSP